MFLKFKAIRSECSLYLLGRGLLLSDESQKRFIFLLFHLFPSLLYLYRKFRSHLIESDLDGIALGIVGIALKQPARAVPHRFDFPLIILGDRAVHLLRVHQLSVFIKNGIHDLVRIHLSGLVILNKRGKVSEAVVADGKEFALRICLRRRVIPAAFIRA